MNWLDAQAIIEAFGDLAVYAVTIIIFLETAFILTSFLPGDSLLFIIGITLAVSQDGIPDWIGFLMIFVAAVAGTQLGYLVGIKVGPPLFERNENWIFNAKVIRRTHEFFERYGARAIVLARFVPILRALVPMLAGIARFDSKHFFRLNLIGATLWVGIFMAGGYFLGGVPLIKENLEIAVIVVILLSSLPFPIELLRHWLKNRP